MQDARGALSFEATVTIAVFSAPNAVTNVGRSVTFQSGNRCTSVTISGVRKGHLDLTVYLNVPAEASGYAARLIYYHGAPGPGQVVGHSGFFVHAGSVYGSTTLSPRFVGDISVSTDHIRAYWWADANPASNPPPAGSLSLAVWNDHADECGT